VHHHHAGDRLAGEAFVDRARRADIVITSYDIATRDVETLQLVQWDRLLLDEAQDVKNPQTRRARSLRLLRARRRVAMTGTPIENHLGELWAIMDLLNPGLLGGEQAVVLDRRDRRQVELDLGIVLLAAQDERPHDRAQPLERVRVVVELDRLDERAVEPLARPEQSRVEQVHDRPQLAEVVLDRRAGHRNAAARAQETE
jgi:hypothetical protein